MTIFDIMKGILLKAKSKEYFLNKSEFNKIFSPYMIARYFSMRTDLIMYARILNHLNTTSLSKEQIFTFIYDAVPKQKNWYISYIKQDKKSKKSKK